MKKCEYSVEIGTQRLASTVEVISCLREGPPKTGDPEGAPEATWPYPHCSKEDGEKAQEQSSEDDTSQDESIKYKTKKTGEHSGARRGEAGVQIFRPPPPSQRGAIFSSVTEKLWQISKGILDRSDRLRHRFNLTSRFGSPECLCFTVEVRDSSQFSLHCYFGKGSKEMKGME
ncbi:hypothetical protein CEXT_305481 [Caerostris extrusa]|uniref:Uncharacterized protein n=1 Tax=Caerostris extrusa TaxID=172846 RepID=A0AAV4RJ08_CAEEX|nr:hypothetical protein CEXT_305481 [Caerostris extrusa]